MVNNSRLVNTLMATLVMPVAALVVAAILATPAAAQSADDFTFRCELGSVEVRNSHVCQDEDEVEVEAPVSKPAPEPIEESEEEEDDEQSERLSID